MKRNRLFVRFKVSGSGAANFPARLYERKIKTYDVLYGDEYCFFSADYADTKKIFAISRNMCYNVKRVGFRGGYAPLVRLAEKTGAVIGALCFAFFAYVSDGFIEEISFYGDAGGYKRELSAALKSEGVECGKRIDGDVSALGEKLAMSIDGIAYATVEKRGKRLIVEVFKEKTSATPMDVKRERIVAPESGKVIKINCLSGEAVVKIGDEVNCGDTLIEGIYVFKDKTVKTYAAGEVGLLCPFVYEYAAAGKDEVFKARAIALAKEKLGEGEILSEKCELIEKDGKITFRVTLDRMITVT